MDLVFVVHRWRNAFLLALVMAIPTVIIVTFHFRPCKAYFIVPGLSRHNLILWILSTIAQVSARFVFQLPIYLLHEVHDFVVLAGRLIVLCIKLSH